MTDPSLLRLVEDALYDPPGEDPYRGLADFSPDRASADVLARGVMRALDEAGYVVLRKR